MKIQIPKPCHESWNKMTQAEKGRHCGVCDKVVTDFTAMTSEEIKEYFLSYKNLNVCGRFASAQVYADNSWIESLRNKVEVYAKNRLVRISALAFLGILIFVSGCVSKCVQRQKMGEVQCQPEEHLMGAVAIDTSRVKNNQYIMGDTVINVLPQDTLKKK